MRESRGKFVALLHATELWFTTAAHAFKLPTAKLTVMLTFPISLPLIGAYWN